MNMAKVNTENVLNQLKEQGQQPPPTPAERTPAQAVGDYLKAMAPTIEKVLPKHMTPDRMARIALGEIRKNPNLLACSVESLGAAVMQAAQLGLEPSTLGHCYFVPFNRKIKVGNRFEWIKDVQFIIGWKGLLDLAWRGGTLVSIMAHEVREKDHFDFAYGLNERLEHVPSAEANRGAVVRYYAYAKLKNGGHVFIVRSREEIVQHAFKNSKQQNSGQLTGPWKDHFDSMAKKTIIRELMKFLPLSTEVVQQVDSDEKIMRGIKEVKDVNDTIIDFEAITPDTDGGPTESIQASEKTEDQKASAAPSGSVQESQPQDGGQPDEKGIQDLSGEKVGKE